MSRLIDIKIIGGWVKWFDTRVGVVGVQKAVDETVKKTWSRLEVKFLGDSKEILVNKRVIIVANHPHESDVLAMLGALPGRGDFKMIANSVLRGIGDNLDKFIIPVYVHHRMESTKVGGIKMRVFGKIHSSTKHEVDEEKAKNKQSISDASRNLDKGGSVLIFPMAGSSHGEWFSGVGHMWTQVKDPKNVRVVMAKIEGTAEWDYVRLIPGVGRLLPKFKVTFSPSYGWKEVGDKNPKILTKNMETTYNRWTESLQELTTAT